MSVSTGKDTNGMDPVTWVFQVIRPYYIAAMGMVHSPMYCLSKHSIYIRYQIYTCIWIKHIHMPHLFEYALPTVMWLIFTQQPFQRLGWTLWYRCGDGYLRGTSWFYGLRRCCSLVKEWLVQEGGKGVGRQSNGRLPCHGGIWGGLEMMISNYCLWFWEVQQECLTWGSSGYPATNPFCIIIQILHQSRVSVSSTMILLMVQKSCTW